MVENASLTDERRLLTTLGGLSEAVEGLDGPAILIVGEVAALANTETDPVVFEAVRAVR